MFRRLKSWLAGLWREWFDESPKPSLGPIAEDNRQNLERIRQWASTAKAAADDARSRLRADLQRHGQIGQSLADSPGTTPADQAGLLLQTLLELEESICDLVMGLPRLNDEAQRRIRIWRAAQSEERHGRSVERFLPELETAGEDEALAPVDEDGLAEAIAEVEIAQLNELACTIAKGELPNGINGHPVIIGEPKLFEEAQRLIETQ